MAQFGPEFTEANEVPTAGQVMPGVQKSSVGVEGLADTIKVAGDLFTSALGDKKEKENNSFLASFAAQQLALINSIEQGANSSTVRSKIRANFAKAMVDYSSLSGDIITIQNTVLGQAGLGFVTKEGSKQEQRLEAVKDKLVQDNWVSPNATDEEMNEGYQAMVTFERQLKTYQIAKEELSLSNLSIDNKQKKEQALARDFMANTSQSLFLNFKNKADKILEEMTTQGLSQAEASQSVEAAWAEFETIMALPRSQADAHFANTIMSGYERLKDVAVKRINGVYTQEAYKAEVDKIITLHQAETLRENPEFARWLANTKLIEGGMISIDTLAVEGMRMINDIMGKNGNEDSDETANLFTKTPEGKKALKSYLDLISQPNATEETKQEVGQHLMRILDGYEDYATLLQRDPEKGIALIDWLGSPQFLELRKSHPEVAANAEAALEIINTHYSSEVWGLVKNEFRDNNVVQQVGSIREGVETKTVPTPDAVTYDITKNGIIFRPINQEDSKAKDKAKRLNKKLAPIINTTVRAMSHLNGEANYQQTLERVITPIMENTLTGGDGQDEAAGGDAGDDLSLESFVSGIEAVEPVKPSEIDSSLLGKVEGAGFTSTGTMSSVDGMIIHHTGGRGNAAGVAKTLVERNASVQFVVDREGKVHQLMPDNQKAWHAGKNNKSGYDNNNTIGVEVIAKDDSDITDVQVEAVKRLIKSMSEKYGFDPKGRVFGHGEVATHKRPTEGQKITSTIRGM